MSSMEEKDAEIAKLKELLKLLIPDTEELKEEHGVNEFDVRALAHKAKENHSMNDDLDMASRMTTSHLKEHLDKLKDDEEMPELCDKSERLKKFQEMYPTLIKILK
jgi:hypothetical protein